MSQSTLLGVRDAEIMNLTIYFCLFTGDETKNPGSLLLWKPSPALTDSEGEWVDYSN